MAVPTAVLRQRERLEAELGLSANPDTPPAATPPAEVPPVAEPNPPDIPPAVASVPASVDAGALQARIAELEHLLKTRDGQTSVSMRQLNEANQRADVLASQVASLEEGLAELQKQKETAEARAAARQADSMLPSFDVEDYTPEELSQFEDSMGFLNKFSKKQLVAYVKPLVEKVSAMEKQLERLSELDELPQLKKVVKQAETENERVREEEFFRTEILAYFGDFETVRETPAWKEYLATDIEGRGIKVLHLLNQYRLVRNAQGIRSLIQTFYDQHRAKPALSDLATPRGTQTEGAPIPQPRFKASDYREKLRLFTNKRLPKTEWDAYKSEFNNALKDNRVEMDARL